MGATPSAPQVDLPQDRTFLITGANTGIGYETAKKIAQYGGRVIMACRSEEKANEAIERMKQEIQTEFNEMKEKNAQDSSSDTKEAPSVNVQYMHLDLSKLQSTMDFVERYKESGLPINVLICNAGVFVDQKVITEDGFETHFQVNYLSHLLLTLHLLPLIKQSGPNSRIINISSKGHFFAEVNLDNIQAQKKFDVTKCYGNSKSYQIMSMYQLAKRVDKNTVSVFSVHPGFVHTNILYFETTYVRRLIINAVSGLARKPLTGAIGPLIAALDPSFNGQTAVYFSEERPKNPYALARNEAKQEIIWNYSLECLKNYLNDDILGEIGMKMADIKTEEHSAGDWEGTDVDKKDVAVAKEGNVDRKEGDADKEGNVERKEGDVDRKEDVNKEDGDVDRKEENVGKEDKNDDKEGDVDREEDNVDRKEDVDNEGDIDKKGDVDREKGDVDRKEDVNKEDGDVDRKEEDVGKEDKNDDKEGDVEKKGGDVDKEGDVDREEEEEVEKEETK